MSNNKARIAQQKAQEEKKAKAKKVSQNQVSPAQLQRAIEDPGQAQPETILQLQQAAGNQAVTNLIQRQSGTAYVDQAPSPTANQPAWDEEVARGSNVNEDDSGASSGGGVNVAGNIRSVQISGDDLKVG